MLQWGWTKGAYKQHWINTNISPLGASKCVDDGRHPSEETFVLQSPTTPAPLKKPTPWHAPIPSPTSAIRSVIMADPPIPTDPSTQLDIPPLPASTVTPGILFENTPSNPHRNSIYWLNMQTYANQEAQMYPFSLSDRSTEPLSYDNSGSVRFLSHPPPYMPKSLDGLVPDPPRMMGVRPRFNGAPVPTFVPHPSMTQQFMHGSTFPGSTFPAQNINRRHSSDYPNTQRASFNPSSQLPYMPDME
jgi:hypothetical protein